MLRNISQKISFRKQGFTLVELLVSVAILGAISLVTVQMLWDTLTVRSKQVSIENSSDNFRLLISTLSRSVQSAQQVSVPNSSTLEIKGSPCRTIRLTGDGSIEEAVDSSVGCVPPSSSFRKITKEGITITKFELLPEGSNLKSVTVAIQASFKDPLLPEPDEYSFQTTMVPRSVL